LFFDLSDLNLLVVELLLPRDYVLGLLAPLPQLFLPLCQIPFTNKRFIRLIPASATVV
jgi:hypothetical protein